MWWGKRGSGLAFRNVEVLLYNSKHCYPNEKSASETFKVCSTVLKIEDKLGLCGSEYSSIESLGKNSFIKKDKLP